MRKSVLMVALMSVLATASSLSHAGGPVDVGVSVGTLGVGPELGYVFIPNTFDVRLSSGFFNYNDTQTSSGVTYNGNLTMESVSALADWHPFSGSFRLTGGLAYNGNSASLAAQPSASGTYTFNGNTYTGAQVGTANAKVSFNPVAPYVGIGWGDDSLKSGFHFTSDIGLMYQGSPNVALSASNPTHNAQLASDVQAAQTTLQNKLNSYQLYPVVSVGIDYRF